MWNQLWNDMRSEPVLLQLNVVRKNFQAEVAHQAELEALQEADRGLRRELEQVEKAANQLEI